MQLVVVKDVKFYLLNDRLSASARVWRTFFAQIAYLKEVIGQATDSIKKAFDKKIIFKPRFHIEIMIFYKNFLRFYEKAVKNVV